CIFPAVLSLAEKNMLSGRKVLVAYIAGMEVIYRVGSSISEYIPRSGWHPTPIIGTIGAVAACANILGLNSAQAQNALGIAASLATGLLKNFGSMTKPMHAGNAARNGVVAAELAASGFTGNNDIFDGEFSFSQMFGSRTAAGLMGAENDLNREWRICTEGLAFKPYPSCRSTHSSIDAALWLRNKWDISTDQVADITCKISPLHTQLARFHKPETGYQGKFSIPYCVATVLCNGSISLEDFTNEKVNNADMQELLSKLSFLYPDVDKGTMDLTAEITITLNSGMKYSHRVSLPKGEPANPMTDEELDVKFLSCSSLILDNNNAQKILNLTRHLEEVKDLIQFFNMLIRS
ncbi:MAG: MmgE/PrpD family protein, partial [Dehalococcoidia bacterium]